MSRPRLADHVFARRHVRDGTHAVALHDTQSGALYVITPDDWAVVRRADGTLSVNELANTAISEAGHPSVDVPALFADLQRYSLVEEGSPSPPRQEIASTLGDVRARGVVALPRYAFRCDGRGECCARYASIALDADDVERATAAVGLASSDGNNETSPMPFAGALRRDRFAMPLVDGRCVALRPDGACGIHQQCGERAKPRACRTYPSILIDDGETIRASVACECSCVFRSADAASDVASVAAWLDALPDETPVARLADGVPITARTVATRDAVARWSRSIVTVEVIPDPIAFLLDQARHLFSLAGEQATDIDGLVVDALSGFRDACDRSARSARAWRSAADAARIDRERCAAAAARAFEEPRRSALFEADLASPAEALYARASIYGLTLAPPLADALVRAAARLLVARELALSDPSADHPIALVERVERSFGR